MSNTKKEWISNWLISNESKNNKNGNKLQESDNEEPLAQQTSNEIKETKKINEADSTEQLTAPHQNKNEKSNQTKNLTKINKKSIKSIFKKKNLTKIMEESELTVSPISGTFIIKEWNDQLKNKFIKKQQFKKKNEDNKFTDDEIMLNSVASNYVQITDEAKYKLSKIVNCIGPYECKLCKVVYNDAFELAMHNCPRVVHFEYRCSECNKIFNCPANLASHKRWHKPKNDLNSTEKPVDMEVTEFQPLLQSSVNESPTQNFKNGKNEVHVPSSITSINQNKSESGNKINNLFEKLPQIIEEKQRHQTGNGDSRQNIPFTSHYKQQQQQNETQPARPDDNQSYTYFNNNDWLSEMYKNYFVAAAAAAVAQNYFQSKHQLPTTNSTTSLITPQINNEIPVVNSSTNLFHQLQNSTQFPLNTQNPSIYSSTNNGAISTSNTAQNFTCKYCYSTFLDNYSLIFHIRKAHSSILLNFN